MAARIGGAITQDLWIGCVLRGAAAAICLYRREIGAQLGHRRRALARGLLVGAA